MDFYHEYVRYRKKSPENTRTGAQCYEAVLRQRLAHGEDICKPKVVEKKSITFQEFFEKWFEIYVKSNNKPSEQHTKRITFQRHLSPFFGKSPLGKISNHKIEEYKALKKRKGLSPKTVNNHLGILNKCLGTAVEWDDLKRAPKIIKLKVPPQTFDFFTDEESKKLLASADGMIYEMIYLTLKTGLRLGEIRALMWSDINWDNRILSVNRALVQGEIVSLKSNKARYIPMTEDLYKMLERRKRSEGFIFLRADNEPISVNYPCNSLKKACKKAGLREISWQ